ncbi:MAG: ABC-type antimicrobial peptide transport system, ATPase component [Herbinix sp.]|jgi:putative ABC transport system ATP-binding protein|nr:ABC-type antimicrobial peptide transport system, ATPase component [Herbinix sp.]
MNLMKKKQQSEAEYSGPLIQLIDIHKVYYMGNSEIYANHGINLEINEGEFVAIIGKSGSGKSTIMNIIGALDVPTSGQYILKGKDVSKMNDNELATIRNKMIGFIFQQYNLLPKERLINNVALPLLYSGMGKEERNKRAMEALKKVDIDDKYRNFPNQMSGGQQQRGAVARALVTNPSLILADEPTGALDSRTSVEILNFLKQLNREGNTIVLITHDRSVAEEANRIVSIQDGTITFDGTVDEYRKQVAG